MYACDDDCRVCSKVGASEGKNYKLQNMVFSALMCALQGWNEAGIFAGKNQCLTLPNQYLSPGYYPKTGRNLTTQKIMWRAGICNGESANQEKVYHHSFPTYCFLPPTHTNGLFGHSYMW